MTARGFPGRSISALLGAGLFALAAHPAAAEVPAPAPGCSGDGIGLEISVTGIREPKGNITITVYPDDKKRFLAKGGKLSRVRIKAEAPVTTACLALPSAGTYAIAVYHDENADGKFNRNFIGLPEEGYGFSNNAEINLAPPSFEAVKFNAGKSGLTRLSITMRY